MSLFSMSWFKSEKQKELEQLKIEGQKLKNEILRKKITPIVVQETPEYNIKDNVQSVKLVNDLLIVVMRDGRILTKQGATPYDFDNVVLSPTEAQLNQIFSTSEGISEHTKNEEEKEKVTKIRSNIQILVASGDFEFKDNAVYMTGVNRSMPELLIEQFFSLFQKYDGLDVLRTDEYRALKKFWLKCCLNPNAQSAEDLYTFLSHHQFKIDKHGNFYAYRRVVSKNDAASKELVDFISNAYIKIKSVWKKSPKNFSIVKTHNNKYHMVDTTNDYTCDGELLDTLDILYKNLPNMKENSYTDAQTESYNYRVGEIISMPRHMGDDNNQVSCSKGFHQASKEYDYSGYGDTPILSIINPIDVLAVPLNEVGKLRVCRWFFATTLPEDEQYILDDEEFDVSDLGDVFEEKCMENLVEHVQNSFAEEVQRHTFNIPQLSNGELNSIVTSLEEMKNVLSKRINVIE